MSWSTLAGASWIGAVLSVLASLAIVLIFDVDVDVADVERTLDRIRNNMSAHFVELGFDVASYLLAGLAGAITARLLLPDRPVAAVAAGVLFTIGAAVGVNHDTANFALGWMVDHAEPGALAAARGMMLQAKWGVSLSAVATLLGILVLCAAVLTASGRTRWLWWSGMACAGLGIAAIPLAWIDPRLTQLGYAMYLPMLVWQLVLGLRLIVAPPAA